MPDVATTLIQRALDAGVLDERAARTILDLHLKGQTSDLADAPEAVRQATERFGKFVLVEKVGEGGMGAVWKAWQVDLRRWVALKFVKGESTEDIARFMREAQLAAKLSHPNIVSTHEAGEHDGRHYISMDYIEGVDLKKRRVDVRQALTIVRDAAEAVHYANRQGIVHRDLKPANLMLDHEGRVRVMDFGLAKSEAAVGLSMTGTVVGTPSYMPPEQAKGQTVDARADVYSLGATLYELVTGHPPFEAETVIEILRRVNEEDPMPPRKLNARLDRDVETIVLKALEKDPARRYTTAKEFSDDLVRELAGDPIAARPASKAYRVYKRVKKQPLLYGLGVLLAVAVIAGTSVAIAAEIEQKKLRKDREAVTQTMFDEEKRQGLIKRSMVSILQAEDDLTDPTIALRETQAKIRDTVEDLTAGVMKYDDADMMFWLGRSYDLLWMDAEAQSWFNKALNNSPNRGQSYVYRARSGLRAYVLTLVLDDPDSAARRQRLIEGIRRDLLQAKLKGLNHLDRFRCEIYGFVGEGSPDAQVDVRCMERIRMGGRTEEAYFILGTILKGDASISAFDQAIERSPRFLEAIIGRGTAKYLRRDYQGAVDDYTRAIELNPVYAEIYVNRSAAFGRLGKAGEALADASRAVELLPNSYRAFQNRAMAKSAMGDLKGSLADSNRAIDLEPADPRSYATRATVRNQLGDQSGAIQDCEKCLEFMPNHANALHTRGVAKAALGDFQAALNDLNRSIEVSPEVPEPYNDRANVLLMTGQIGKALHDASKALELKPDFARAYVTRGNIRSRYGNYQGEIEDCTNALSIDPGLVEAYNNRGWAKGRLGDYKGEIEDCDKALQLNGGFLLAYYNRAFARGNLGDHRGAVDDYSHLLSIAPLNWPQRQDAENNLETARRLAGEQDDF